MTDYKFEEVAVPHGAFMSWADKPGQEVVGKVLEYDSEGGTDFNGNVCPQVIVELVAPTYSVTKTGDRFDYDTGDMVTLNAGLANLKRVLRAADPKPGDVIKVTFAGLEKADRGTVKVFGIQIARGAGKPNSKARQPVTAPAADTPPF